MILIDAEIGKEYTISGIHTDDDELDNFLFTLGCYPGQKIVVISKLSKNFTVSILDARYTLGEDLAEVIMLEV